MSVSYSDNPKLSINELLASNASINLDPDFSGFSDWVEIYNPEDTVVNIAGYYLTDDLSNPFKFEFPEGSIIQPNNYFIVWADDKDYQPGNYYIYPEDIDIVVTGYHANFKLKKSGLWTFWNDNGQKIKEVNWKDGEEHGLKTTWYDNGKKKEVENYKNGEKDGLDTWWFDNGQREFEGTFKNGELISEKCWDKDGNERDCN